jgi:hypothetical protein
MEQPTLTPLRLKLDPASKTTGLALLNEQSGQVVFAAKLSQRGHSIKRKKEQPLLEHHLTRPTLPPNPPKCNRPIRESGVPAGSLFMLKSIFLSREKCC